MKPIVHHLLLHLALLLVIISGLLGSCAVSDVDHMSTTNYVDRTITPDNKVAQWAMLPVHIPATVLTLLVDNLIIAPVVHLPSAWNQSVGFFKADMDGYYANAGFYPFKVVLTPVVFISSWTFRSLFAIETDEEAAWTWPAWGQQWQRDVDGRLVGPPTSNTTEEAP